MVESVRTVLFDIIARDRASQAFQSAGKGAETMGAKVTGVGKTMTKTITPAAGAIGLAFKQAFDEFDSGADTIRAGTGATGKALDGLTKSMKNVAVGVAEPISTVGQAIADVNQRLGLTGKPLEGLTKQFVNLAHVTGTDVHSNIEQVTAAFNNFGVAAGDQPKKLDELFRASQLTGVSIAQLAQDMASNGPILRSAGVGFDQAAALLGALGKAGLSASDVVPSISKALAKAAKEGKPANEVLAETFRAIKNAKTDTEGTAAALEVFGARGGPKLAALIREGKLSFDDLKNSIVTGKDTINKTAHDTADWSEKLQMLKNRIQVVIGPIGQTGMAVAGVAAGIGPTLIGLGKLGPAFSKVGKGAGTMGSSVASGAASIVASSARAVAGAVSAAASMIASFVATAASAVASAATTAAAWLVAAAPFIALGLVIAGVVILIIKNWDTIKNATAAAWNAVVGAVKAAVGAVVGAITGAINWLRQNWTLVLAILTGPIGLAVLVISRHLDQIIGFFTALPGRILGALGDIGEWLVDAGKKLIGGLIKGIKNAAAGIGGAIGGAVKGAASHIPVIGGLFKRAAGGPVAAGTGYLVGEQGPEYFVPRASGTIVPNHALAGGRSGDTWNIKVYGNEPRQTALEIVYAGRRRAYLRGR